MKLITPTFEESSHFHNPMLMNSQGNVVGNFSLNQGPFYEEWVSNSIQGMAPKAHGDSDRHNLEYQECEANPHAMMAVASSSDRHPLSDDVNMLQTPPMCFEDLSYQRYKRRLLQ